MSITAEQLRAARAFLKLEQRVLAEKTKVPVQTLKRYEAGAGPLSGNYQNITAIVKELEDMGIAFTEDGIRRGGRAWKINVNGQDWTEGLTFSASPFAATGQGKGAIRTGDSLAFDNDRFSAHVTAGPEKTTGGYMIIRLKQGATETLWRLERVRGLEAEGADADEDASQFWKVISPN